jgi:hypothetical protein
LISDAEAGPQMQALVLEKFGAPGSAGAAHQAVETGTARGKLVVSVPGPV